MDISYVHAPLNRLNTVDLLNHGIILEILKQICKNKKIILDIWYHI